VARELNFNMEHWWNDTGKRKPKYSEFVPIKYTCIDIEGLRDLYSSRNTILVNKQKKKNIWAEHVARLWEVVQPYRDLVGNQ
jgi:hypothetical protein